MKMLGWKLYAIHRLLHHSQTLCVSYHCIKRSRGGQFSSLAPDPTHPSPKSSTVEKWPHNSRGDITEEIRRRLSLQDECLDHARISSIVNVLAHREIPEDLIIETLSGQSVLVHYDAMTWSKVINMVAQNGFHKGQILQLIASRPDILSGRVNSRDLFHQAISTLRNLGFASADMGTMVTANPDIIAVPSKLLVHNLATLREAYRESSARASCRHHPQVLTRPPCAVEHVLDYCHGEMGVRVKDTLRANAFVYSIGHISLRHKFLARSGLYERPDKHGVTSIENPALQDILEMSNKQFAVKLGKATLAEYNVFCQMLQQEEEEEVPDAEDDEAVDFGGDDEAELFGRGNYPRN